MSSTNPNNAFFWRCRYDRSVRPSRGRGEKTKKKFFPRRRGILRQCVKKPKTRTTARRRKSSKIRYCPAHPAASLIKFEPPPNSSSVAWDTEARPRLDCATVRYVRTQLLRMTTCSFRHACARRRARITHTCAGEINK